MKRNKLRMGVRLLACSVAASLLLVGCSSNTTKDDGSGTSDKKSGDMTMTFLPKNLGNAYFDTSLKGAEAAGKAVG
ncbi:MAG: rhamnose ABC transporter substrate-binding protein, partial [Actinomycetales bacterium]